MCGGRWGAPAGEGEAPVAGYDTGTVVDMTVGLGGVGDTDVSGSTVDMTGDAPLDGIDGAAEEVRDDPLGAGADEEPDDAAGAWPVDAPGDAIGA